MSNTYPSSAPETPEVDYGAASNSGSSTADRAADVKDTSVAAGQHVADAAKDGLHRVSGETKQQARDLYRQTQSELADQAATQQKRVASGLRSLSDELGSMAEKSDTQGVASDLAHQAASRAGGVADWLDQRDPGSLLDEVKSFARRKPGMFITIAAVAGVVAGRLTRSVIAEAKDSSDTGAGTQTAAPAPTPTADSEFGAVTGVDTAFDSPVDEYPTTARSGDGARFAADYPDNRNE
jgi:hypothetical protein